ncbi:MAG: ribosome maturation factor RimP [Psychrobacillus sp.]
MSNITSKMEELVLPILQEMNLELVDIEYVKEGRDWFLRVYIDTPNGGIDIEQCAQVSNKLSEKLDEEDPIKENYFLEVSSPGAERPLKKEADFIAAVGKYVFIKTYEQINGAKEFEGTLLSYSAEEGALIEIRIKTRRVKIQIEKEKIALARLAIDFSA